MHYELGFNLRKVMENTKCPVLITGREGDTVISWKMRLVAKLSD
ncbi:hypothetical protein [Wolbachia endosymbiont of Onchocerca volvulus]|nr:hypothetical protein [Wolbachia endosymbiont of Onchocerca volvulus]